ncbi:hypothetical protein ACQJBY_001139 [Aegilops geniculata]
MVGIFHTPDFEGLTYVDGVLFNIRFKFIDQFAPNRSMDHTTLHREKTLANFGKGKLKRHYICNTCTILSSKIISVLMSSLVDKLIVPQSLKTLIVAVSFCVVNAFNSVGAIFFEALKI